MYNTVVRSKISLKPLVRCYQPPAHSLMIDQRLTPFFPVSFQACSVPEKLCRSRGGKRVRQPETRYGDPARKPAVPPGGRGQGRRRRREKGEPNFIVQYFKPWVNEGPSNKIENVASRWRQTRTRRSCSARVSGGWRTCTLMTPSARRTGRTRRWWVKALISGPLGSCWRRSWRTSPRLCTTRKGEWEFAEFLIMSKFNYFTITSLRNHLC